MAMNEAYVEAPPERVFAVLADGERYGEWVVGTRAVRQVDGGFPGLGHGLTYEVGAGPLRVVDRTVVIAAEPPRRLGLAIRVGALGRMQVDLELTPDGAGTRVTMRERPVGLRARLLVNPVVDAAIRVRNVEALRRLRRLAEEPAGR